MLREDVCQGDLHIARLVNIGYRALPRSHHHIADVAEGTQLLLAQCSELID